MKRHHSLTQTKLLHVTTVPFSFFFFTGQIGYMQQRGFEVHALSSPGPLLTDFATREQVTVHAVNMLRQISPLRDLVALAQICWNIRQIGPTIVHAHTPKGGLLGTVAAWLMGAPVRVYHIRGLPFMTATGYKRVLLWWSEKIACTLADQVLCVSHSIRDVAIEAGICRADKIKVLLGGSGNGVDAMARFNPNRLDPATGQTIRQQYGIPAGALVIGFIGRIVRDKGIEELVTAWQTLRQEFPDIHLLVVGPFEPQDPVSQDIEAVLRTDPQIHLVGEDWDTPQFYAAMDFLVLPTYREGFPNVPLEAASMELPVVATRIPGCIDAIEADLTGILVPVQDAVALADGMRIYMQNSPLRRQHGLAGRQRVLTQFRQEAIWEALYQEYALLLAAKGFSMPDLPNQQFISPETPELTH